MKILFNIFLIFNLGLALEVLEPADGTGIYFGPWYDRLNKDSPKKLNERLAYKPMSFFQSDMNITDKLQSAAVDEFISQVNETNTDAFVYLTIYPIDGFDAMSDAALDDLASKIKGIADSGRKTLLRFASEMNGNWFKYGQQPTKFIQVWRKVHEKIKSTAGKDNVAFLWAPNSGNGYPFITDDVDFPHNSSSPKWDPLFDTNKDGIFTAEDDPYSPYYPGDDYVDWVGFSLYHYGNDWNVNARWSSNDIPASDKAENILRGRPDPLMPGHNTKFDIYQMFSGTGEGGQPSSASKGGKPFFITESAGTVFLAVQDKETLEWQKVPGSDEETRMKIKQSWWRQILDPDFLQRHPKIKGIGTFEFIKQEEQTWRDFTVFGKGTEVNSIFGGDGGDLDGKTLTAIQEDLRGKYGQSIIWAKNLNVETETESNDSWKIFLPIAIVGALLFVGLIFYFQASIDLVDITYAKLPDKHIEDMIDSRVQEFLQFLDQETPKRLTMGIAFHDKGTKKGWFAKEGCWEEWLINIAVTRAKSEKEQIMAKSLLAAEVTDALIKISLETGANRDHIPKIVNSDPFPFSVICN